jgi:hypothetical protein
MVYKRWKGKKLKPGDPNYDRARWWMEYRLNGRRIHKAISEARTKARLNVLRSVNEKRSTTGDTTKPRT